jgi:hypothetical protein
MKPYIMQHRKASIAVVVFVALLLILAIGLYPYQKHAAITYLTSQGCNDSTYAATAGDTPCSSGSGISMQRLFMGIGVHYSYQTLGGGDGLSVGVNPACNGGSQPAIYSGDIVSIPGKQFVFDAKTTIPQPTGGIAC